MFGLFNDDINFNQNTPKSEKFVKLLLFLFPVCAVSVRNWASLTYILICVSSLAIYLSNVHRFKPKKKYDYILPAILSLFFISYLLSALVNGWDTDATYALGVEIRFIAIIPLYFLLREYKGYFPYLMLGTLLGILTSFATFLYEFLNIGHGNSGGIYIHFTNGPYGHLFIGPITALFVIVVVNWNIKQKQSFGIRLFTTITVLLGFFPIIHSYARSAYLACFVAFFLITFLSLKGKRRYLFLVLMIVGAYLVFTSVPKVKHRVDSAVNEVKNYFSAPNPALNPRGFESIQTRLEMWRSAKYFLRDHPIFGVGRFHYHREVEKYVKQKLVHPAAATGSQPHNIFIEALIEKGLVGLIGLLAMIFWPIIKMLKHSENPYSSVGIITILTIVVLGLTESAPIDKGNFTAVFMVYLVSTFTAFKNYQESNG